MRHARLLAALLALVIPVLLRPLPAAAHPHVWVNAQVTVVYDNGRITGLKHRWQFDEMYSTMAIQGLDANNDGIYSREELAELTKVNMEGLKEFNYFTVVKLGDDKLRVKEPTDAYLEVDKQGVLTLVYTLPLAEPVLADAKGFTFAVYDATFFIAFELTGAEPVKLSGAPTGCKVDLSGSEKESADLKRLNEAFGGQLTAGNANQGAGLGYAQTVGITCAKG